MHQPSSGFGFRLLRFISQLLKSLWLFFPGILFLLLPVFCFWMLGQGKDIIVAFIDNDLAKSFFHFNYTRTLFFLIIGFWVYVSWYSSRIIAYIKKKQQEKNITDIARMASNKEPLVDNHFTQTFHEVGQPFLDEFPRIIGNACFLILELAVLQLPVLNHPINTTVAGIIFICTLIIIRYINNWIDKTQSKKRSFRNTFWVLFWVFIALVIAVSFIGEIDILTLFFLLLFFHVVFIYYTNLRRAEMEKKALAVKMEVLREDKTRHGLREQWISFVYRVKKKDTINTFCYISLAGIALYFINIISLSFARHTGPFSTIILAFAVLLAFGNVVTAFSVRSKVNFHSILFLLAFIIGGLHETHYVRTNELTAHDNGFLKKASVAKIFNPMAKQRDVLANTSDSGYDIYFVMANGGASRSGYWTASVLGKIEDSLLIHDTGNIR